MVDLSSTVPVDELFALEPVQLHALYRDLQSISTTRDLTDQELYQACAIMRALRRKSSGPPKAARPKRVPLSPIIASEDAL